MNRTMYDALEDLALQVSNLWDAPELVDQARVIFGVIYKDGCPVEMDDDSVRHNLSCVGELTARLREWCDMTDSASATVEDVLEAEAYEE